ncbi:MAG: aspartate kinase [Betaproteobacteria bacterium TMED156]|nr:MAG: aspartate kinase [Betaproteobacteria bacterium TMED156]
MKLVVHKYGGTSVGSTTRIIKVAQRIKKWHKAGYSLVVVTSAMSGETNKLLNLINDVSKENKNWSREVDQVVSSGEQVAAGLLAIALNKIGILSTSYAGWQVSVNTDSAHTKARIKSIDTEKIQAELRDDKVVIVTGFQGVNKQGFITTLGRGGSDTSAVALAASLEAQECLIFTDVDGVYTTDPRIEPDAKRLSKITFEEMLEMSSLGSKILQIRSVEFAGKYKINLRVLSSLTDTDIPIERESVSGTLITFEEENEMEDAVISGIAFNRDEAKITITGVPDTPGVASKILGPVAKSNIDVDMIIQNSSHDGTTDFSFTVNRVDLDEAIKVIRKDVQPEIKAIAISSDNQICKISVVGIGMRSHVGVASQMFEVLFNEGINIKMISTSEIKISVVIDDKYMELAVRSLHKAFGLGNK